MYAYLGNVQCCNGSFQFGPLFGIFNCLGILNLCNVHTASLSPLQVKARRWLPLLEKARSLSPLLEKSRSSIHYSKIRSSFSCFLRVISLHTSLLSPQTSFQQFIPISIFIAFNNWSITWAHPHGLPRDTIPACSRQSRASSLWPTLSPTT